MQLSPVTCTDPSLLLRPGLGSRIHSLLVSRLLTMCFFASRQSLPVSTSSPVLATPSHPPPAGTRFADFPEPQSLSTSPEPASAPTKIVEVILDDDELDGAQEVHIGEDGIRTVTVLRSMRPSPRPRRWLW